MLLASSWQLLDRATICTVLCLQVCKILAAFPHSADRVELVMCLYNRIADKENFWTVLYALKVCIPAPTERG